MSEEQNDVEKPEDVKYAILGCGSTGTFVADYLHKKEEKFLIIELDPDKVEDLRDKGYYAVQADIKALDEVDLDLSEVQQFLILSSDHESNIEALKQIKGRYPETLVIVRAVDPVYKQTMKDIGGDIVLHPAKVISDAAIRNLERMEIVRKTGKLKDVITEIGSDRRLGIFLHSNPDPDSIAAGYALQRIASQLDIESDIVYSGEIGHQENRAFVNLLDIDLIRFEEVGGIEGYEKIALVDNAIPGQNNVLPKDIEVDIVIDHHDIEVDLKGDFIDIRNDVGSTSTIMTKYLQELDIFVDEDLATALLFGIRTDTLEFKRNVNPADMTAANFLYSLADRDRLQELESPAMDAETLDILGDAIKNREVYGSYLLSGIKESTDKDALIQAADYLLQLEGITTVIVYGIVEDTVHLSARNKDVRVDIGEILRRAFQDIGSAGGHTRMAGGQIPIQIYGAVENQEILNEIVSNSVKNRVLDIVGIETEKTEEKPTETQKTT
ncbi:nanoRNase/pAp phosphatase hydrolyzes c-di-AMP and oligoRNAs NrnA [Methanonatronarchaeum thermophilum]|uniref:NanoRNase/pAp phosphatase hydrolyzes c-di-AMP and oligoRNAs NrnA n=1 Tax=Methanonatronarchaeum thermophilum TaxID=1927129 RepID=A0A1Y3GDE1_9EURY|nr:DHH family phosphoesterase [Methanonatronarchaeum thermophilum]OUJ19471.1 nanoRNase/pAp phosphatase hydrolyzes c-di-AMP and oligoRNAs NrnA [Methanonatronarchaeum thermophilum]